jgi:soluble lytic murein transglycosylase
MPVKYLRHYQGTDLLRHVHICGTRCCIMELRQRTADALKQVGQSGNPSAMRVVHNPGVRLLCFLMLIAMAGWIAASVGRASSGAASDSIKLAQLLPFERNKVEPIDPKAAFAEGYQAYKRRDYIEAIGRMQLAAAKLPDLVDYALFYLACSERETGDHQSAANDFRRLAASYPQSVFAESASLGYAQLELGLGRSDYALLAATSLADTTADPTIEQSARLVMARALIAAKAWRAAYDQVQIIRQKFPAGTADAEARALAYVILRAHPQASGAPPLEYHRTEAALLLREGQNSQALTQVRLALALSPSWAVWAELTWYSAEASRGNPGRMKAALQRYLQLAPDGMEAPLALNALAHLYWHEQDTGQARLYFGRLVRQFTFSRLAPVAMFEIGRTYEEEGDLVSARQEYQRLVARYAGSDAAADARFRAPFMLYMLRRYDQAGVEFGEASERARTAGEHDMFSYWNARALENGGEITESRRILHTLALSTSSNYYPALAAMRLNSSAPVLPASLVPELAAGPIPVVAGPAEFHLVRVAVLRELGLHELEAAELRRVENHLDGNMALRDFVLAELQSSGAWFDAIGLAMRMAARGELDPAAAERIRYPRGFWELVNGAALRNGLDPYLVAALIRQESLFNPLARSGSDARGLMQLLPATASRYALTAGIATSPLDLFDPNVSVQLGTVYLRGLMDMFGGDKFKAVAAYNAGEHAVGQWNAKYPGDDDQWVENISYRETRDYVKKVIGGRREYQLLYESPSGASASTHESHSPG